MSTPIQQIRSMIQDLPLFQDDTFVLVAGQLRFQLKYFPVVAGSVIITGTNVAFTVTDASNGVVVFASAPGADVYGVQYTTVLLGDSTIQDILDVNEDSDIEITAAACLDSIASQQALILKRIKMLDLDIDGPAVAKSLREHAKSLREAVLGEFESVFDVAEQVETEAGWREKVYKDWERQNS